MREGEEGGRREVGDGLEVVNRSVQGWKRCNVGNSRSEGH